MSDLLPYNATKPERAMANTIARMSAVPCPVRELWSPQTCPAAVLPWLAFALSVDNWDATWTEQQKRDSIAASIEVHKHKGTIGAIRSAIMALGFDGVQVIENQSAIFVFKLRVRPCPDGVPSEAALDKLEDVAVRAKNERSHLEKIEVLLEDGTTEYIGAALTDSLGVDMLDELQANTAPQFIANTPNVTEFLCHKAISGATCADMAIDVEDGSTLTWAKTSGAAFFGVAADGTLTGTPLMEGTWPITVQATDSDGASTSKIFNLVAYGWRPYIGGKRGSSTPLITQAPTSPKNCVKLAALSAYELTQAYALLENGKLACWPGIAPSGMPTTGVVDICANNYDSSNYAGLALKTDGTVAAWGAGEVITNLPALSGVRQVVTTGRFAIAVLNDGSVVAWGTHNISGMKAAAEALSNVKAVAIDQSHGLALRNDGTVVGFGSTIPAANNTPGTNHIPVGLVAKAIGVGREHSVAVQLDGTVVCWGNNYWGACNIPAGTVAKEISVASVKTVVVTPDGMLVTAGTQSTYNEITQITSYATGKQVLGAFVNMSNQSGIIFKS